MVHLGGGLQMLQGAVLLKAIEISIFLHFKILGYEY